MSTDTDHGYGPTPPGAGFEHTDIEPGVGYRFALWLAVAMLLSAALVYGVFSFFERRRVAADEAMRVYPLGVGQSQEPPAPRLQTQPFKDVFQLKTEQRDALNSYGWIDKANGVTHIPIERAMHLMLERGVPVRPNATSVPSLIVEDSSAGRTTAPR
jgi:hypothetical protein